MKLPARLRMPLAFLFRRAQCERDMDEERRSHLRLRAQDLERQGVPRAAAERRARIEFGAAQHYQEECRAALGVRLLSELAADVRHGARQLRRHPAFTAVALLTLALGIGANAAIFSMLNGIFLRALPYEQPQRLYVVHEVVPQWSGYAPYFGVNAGNFRLWQSRCPAFAGMAEVIWDNFVLTGQGNPLRVRAALVPANFFPLLGVHPRLGRGFLSSEQQRGHDQEVVLSDQLWRQAFHADPAILGRSVTLDGAAFAVVGILPADFRFPGVWGGAAPALYKPVVLAGYDLDPGIGNFRYSVIARLRPGATAQQALAELNAVEAGIARRGDPVRHVAPGRFDLHAMLVPLKTAIAGAAARALWMLAVAATLVLLIICANLANLLLAKNSDRAREVAVRTALGATARRLTRQFLTEGFLLAAAGGALGLALAAAALRLLVRTAPLGIPRVDDIHLDATVLLFTLGISILAALLFAVLPVLLLVRVPPAATLKAAGSRLAAGSHRGRLRSGLVVAEVALCAILLVGALLLMQSLARVTQANQWMQQEHVLALELVTPSGTYRTEAALDRFYSDILAKVRSLPGVVAAAFTPILPLRGGSWGDDVVFREAPRPASDTKLGDFYFISPGFSQAIGLPLVEGRLLSEQDRGKDVVLISQSIARRLLPGRDPIGAHLLWAPNDKPVPREVIGVVGDVRTAPDAAATLAVYVPLWSFSEPNESLIVRTGIAPGAAGPALRRAVWSVNPQVAMPSLETLQSVIAASTGPRRYETSLGALFALCAVVLAAIGLYGVISYSVSQRAHEIGIRMALGARSSDVLRSVVVRGMALALSGVVVGLGAALVLARSLSGLLYGIQPNDPLTFLAVALLLSAVALLACFLPARRATRVDPTMALRCE